MMEVGPIRLLPSARLLLRAPFFRSLSLSLHQAGRPLLLLLLCFCFASFRSSIESIDR
jgi:hypothetical protein